jgi:hypothetical protein
MSTSWSIGRPQRATSCLDEVSVFEVRRKRLLARTAQAWGLHDNGACVLPTAGYPPGLQARRAQAGFLPTLHTSAPAFE